MNRFTKTFMKKEKLHEFLILRECVQYPNGGGRGIRSCLLQSNLGQQFLCFAKAFGQPLKTTHRVVFLTLSFESL